MNVKKLVILSILLIGIMITVSACSVTQKSNQKPLKNPTTQTPSTKTPTHTTQISGTSIYDSKCASCHGANGVGTKKGPALNTGKWSTSDEQKLAQDIMTGNPAKGMPAFKNSLGNQQLTAVAQYIVRLKK